MCLWLTIHHLSLRFGKRKRRVIWDMECCSETPHGVNSRCVGYANAHKLAQQCLPLTPHSRRYNFIVSRFSSRNDSWRWAVTPAVVGRSYTTEIQRAVPFVTNRALCYLNGARRSGGQDSAEREQVSPGLVFALKLNSVWVGLPPTPGMHRGCVRWARGECSLLFENGIKFLQRRLLVTPQLFPHWR